jgi:hypothetical protein
LVGLETLHQQLAAGAGGEAKLTKISYLISVFCVLHSQQQRSNMPAAAPAANTDTRHKPYA